MKKKKKIILIIVILSIVLLTILGYFIFNFKNSNSLTLEENEWLDSNKYNVIDISILNDIPVLSYDGDGLVYDFLEYVTTNLSLKFNIIPQKLDTENNDSYKMDIVDKPKDSDIILLKDNMVLITKDKIDYKDVSSIKDLKLGILSSDSDLLNEYFKNNNIEFVKYDTYATLKSSLLPNGENVGIQNVDTQNVDTQNVDGIIISKTLYTKELIENNYNISYQFDDLNKYFILSFSNKTLNLQKVTMIGKLKVMI